MKADNSELTEMLSRIAAQGGMTVEGSAPSQKIFGQYGPDAPKKVLAELLAGCKCGFVMTGTAAQGLPRSLLLLPQHEGATAAQPARTPDTSNASSPSNDIAANRMDSPSATPQAQKAEDENPVPLGPGAIAHVPPGEDPGAEGGDPAVRIQRNLDRLSKIQEQQNGHP